MKTNVIPIRSDLSGRTEAMREAERFSAYYGLTGKDAMHIRLLTEESISMVNGIIRGFEGTFWLESEPTPSGILCRICVAADVRVNEGQEDQLLHMATYGKNEEASGILGKIRELFRWSMRQADAESFAQSNMIDNWFAMGVRDDAYWSLRQYTKRVQEAAPGGEEWDELEKSIIARLSDEVRVGIRAERAEVMIEKYIHNRMKTGRGHTSAAG